MRVDKSTDIYMYTYVYAHTHVCICISAYICMHIYISVLYIYICMYAYMYLSTCHVLCYPRFKEFWPRLAGFPWEPPKKRGLEDAAD